MTEVNSSHPETTTVKPNENIRLEPGKPILIGRNPAEADIDPKLKNNCSYVNLKIPNSDIYDYLPRATLFMLSKNGDTTVAVPHEQNKVPVTTYNLKHEPITLNPGDRTYFKDRGLEQVDIDVNGHILRLRFYGTENDDQFFRIEVDPKPNH